ncbi:MAG: ribosomal protein S18-alanine N-acetyltransferase [Bacillaceae bacterium]
MQVAFREMEASDLDKVVYVEEQSFTLPWKKEMFQEDLNNPYADYLVIEHEGEIIGYCGTWVVFEDAQITNIAVLPSFRGKKLGEQLLKTVIDRLKQKNVSILSLEVRVSNKVAQNLYRKLGFQEGGIRKGYYKDNHEDAVVMWVKIDE